MIPRRQRHTIRRVHDRLSAQTDCDGEYSTAMRYMHRWREANREQEHEGYARPSWSPGSMQVDFGIARASLAGESMDVHCLVVCFPYSNMRLCVALPGENAECLCHGLMLVFEHIGGVPPLMVLDNATGAGHRNAKGEVRLTHVFESFLLHHRIEARFCNPYSGNEKGGVENAVGFLRRNLMVPALSAESHAPAQSDHAGALRRAGGQIMQPAAPGRSRQAMLRPGAGHAHAGALDPFRPGAFRDALGGQVRAGRSRLEPVLGRPRRRAIASVVCCSLGHAHAHGA